ncbi:RcnB family protein [Paraburkholderia sp.]|uniref:RcnB family protein n=1 Tax=Paraburkholderia sp. TaxID=1926495 RepID=UPI003D6E7BC8
MKSKTIAQLVIVSLLSTSTAVFAQQRPDDHGRPDHGGPRGHAYRDADMHRDGGPVPHEDWHRGDRLPAEYRDRNYVVDDWRGHGLEAPPRGYHWVGVNGDYVLAAVATGVIASVLLQGH